MTTALEQWGSAQGAPAGADDELAADIVHEGDITGDGHEGAESLGQEPHDELAHSPADDADAAAHAAKKAKDLKTLKLMGAVAAALVVGTVGVGVMKARSNAQQVEIAQAQPQAAPDNSALAPVAAASAVAQPVITERADGVPSTVPTTSAGMPPTPDFGLQANTAPQPAVAPAAQPTAAVLPAAAAVPVPVTPAASTAVGVAVATRTNALQTPVADVGKGVKSAQAQATKQGDAGASAAPEVQQLRDDVAQLRTALADKDGAIAQLRAELDGLKTSMATRSASAQPHPMAQRPAQKAPVKMTAPAPKATPPVSGITETVVATSTPAVVTPPATKGKVRSDYRIYAMTDGRVWVVGQSQEPFQISARSPLPDGSRVTSIDAEKFVVVTTAGEIH